MAIPIILKVYDGGKLKVARAFRSELIRIGSGPGVDLVLDGQAIAPHHAALEVGGSGVVLRALGSAQVQVNGQPILAAPVRHGDLLSLGEVRILIELHAEKKAPVVTGVPRPARPHLEVIENEEAPQEMIHHPSARPALSVVRSEVEVAEADPGDEVERLSPSGDSFEMQQGEVEGGLIELLPPPPAPAPAPRKLSAVPTAREPAANPSTSAAVPAAAEIRAAIEESRKLSPVMMDAGQVACAQVELLWGATRLSVWTLDPGEELTAGADKGCRAFLPGIARHAVVRSDPTGWTLCAPRPLQLTLIEEGRPIGGPELLVRGRCQTDAEGLRLPLPSQAVAVLSSGSVSLRVRRVPLASQAAAEAQDWKGAVATTLAAFLLVGLMKLLTHGVQPTSSNTELNPEVIRSRLQVHASFKVPPMPVRKGQAAQGRRDPGRAVARHEGLEGEAGKVNAPRRNLRAERTHDPSKLLASAGLLKALGGGKGGDSFGVALEKGARDAMGHLNGPKGGEAGGDGGMGLKSLGGTGGGGEGTGLGLARIGTNGIGGGTAGYGSGHGGLGGKGDAEIGLSTGQPQVQGSIDPELIRKVVREHRAQIRTCYELQLAQSPHLAGKVIAAWTIDAQGGVVEAHTQESTLKEHGVESCVASKIRTWHFPLPKGGGEVFVTYPFIFTPGG